METEVVSMTLSMLNGNPNCAGSLTSGGTESILMACKTYRDRARALYPHIINPNMVAAQTVHPAFEKAAHYFGIEIIHVPVNESDARMNIEATAKAINSSTILLVGSAPQYPHGVIDPIEDLSALALKHSLPLHVDACFGGFMLPWVEKIGYEVPLWDFRVPGVTSISADIHKYGYSSKGASVISYSSEEIRSYQYFAYAEWPGGLFGSPSLTGKFKYNIISLSHKECGLVYFYVRFLVCVSIDPCIIKWMYFASLCRFPPWRYDSFGVDNYECYRAGWLQSTGYQNYENHRSTD